MDTECDIAELQSVFAARPRIAAAVLFGSRAHGGAGFDSDLDLAVLPDRPLNADERFELICEIAQRLGHPIDLIDLAAEHGLIAREALLRSRRIFCRDRLAYAEYLRRLVCHNDNFLSSARAG